MIDTSKPMTIDPKPSIGFAGQYRYKKQKRIPVFPQRLYDMLEQAEERGYDHVFSWMPDGKSFKIHLNGAGDPESEKIIVKVLKSNNFHQTKFRSFLRQLNQYGFERTHRGPRKGECRHDFFVRGCRDLLEDKSIDDFQQLNCSSDESDEDNQTPGRCLSRLLQMSTQDHKSLFLQSDNANYWKPTSANNTAATPSNQAIPMVPTSTWQQMYEKRSVVPTMLHNLHQQNSSISDNRKQQYCPIECKSHGGFLDSNVEPMPMRCTSQTPMPMRCTSQMKVCFDTDKLRSNKIKHISEMGDDETIPTIGSESENNEFDDWIGCDLERVLRQTHM